ncbi:MAG: hypothetical protein NWF11_08350 [Candidatus Bathyarchaeota archaeon]|nr:hypothetical protein [Candidatus Bathyarchaeota archaeon]
MTLQEENCENPWKADCSRTDIELYITTDMRQLPICTSCWDMIAEQDLEWEG